VIVRHANVHAEATGPSGATVTYMPAKVRRATSVTYSKRSGTIFRLGKTTVTITAKNRAGTDRSSFAVFVADTTPPVLSTVSDIETTAADTSGATVMCAAVTARDLVDKNVAVTCSPQSGSVFAIGTTTVTCAARDNAGNKATQSFNVTVTEPLPPGPKVDVCHVDRDGVVRLTTIDQNTLAAHLAHGDALPGAIPLPGSAHALNVAIVASTRIDPLDPR
jgi:hypothetical protein